MKKSKTSKAKEQVAESKKDTRQFLKDKEKARQERAKRMARLKELRLEKEALDKED